MLDEIKEFEQYTFNLNDEKIYAGPLKKCDCRLKTAPLVKSFSGINRAMTIIARYYMFNQENNTFFSAKDADHIKKVLRAWCGFQSQKNIPGIDGWLNLYIRKAAFYNPAKACVEEFIKTKVILQKQLNEYENKKAEIKKQRPRLGDKNLTLAVKEKYPELIDAIIFDKLEKIFPETVQKKVNNKDISVKEITESIALKTTLPDLEEKKEKLDKVEKKYHDELAQSEILKNLSKRISGVKKIINALVRLKNKDKTYNKSFYNSNFKSKPFDLYYITFDRIIANACTMGRLEQYYLVCGGNPFEIKTIKKNTTEANPQSTKQKEKLSTAIEERLLDLGNSDKDLILKITANYLLQKRFTDQEYVVFNKTDLANWMWIKSKADNFNLFMYKLDTGDRKNERSAIVVKRRTSDVLEPLFDTYVLGADKEHGKKGIPIVKIKLHPDWIKLFRLVKIQDITKPENKNLLYFSDGCQNSYLVVNNWKGKPVFEDKEEH